jgi:DNA replication protein DnaC
VASSRGAKTVLEVALLKEKLDLGWSGLYRSTPDLFAEIREGERYNTEHASESEVVKTLMNVRILAIDDLGAESVATGREAGRLSDVLFRIMDHRVSWMLPTIITTNLNSAQLADAVTKRVMHRIVPPSISRIVNLRPECFPDLRERTW